MFKPNFDHKERYIYKAAGIPKDKMDIIRKFQIEYGFNQPHFDSPSKLIEYYWERIPEELKDDPFFTFYLGIFVRGLIQEKVIGISMN